MKETHKRLKRKGNSKSPFHLIVDSTSLSIHGESPLFGTKQQLERT